MRLLRNYLVNLSRNSLDADHRHSVRSMMRTEPSERLCWLIVVDEAQTGDPMLYSSVTHFWSAFALRRTHLGFSSRCLLNKTSRHWGADGVAPEEAPHRVAESQCHQLLRPPRVIGNMWFMSVIILQNLAQSMCLTWLLSTLYPCLRAKVFPSEIDMAYPTIASAKASPTTSPKTLTSGTLGERRLVCRRSTRSNWASIARRQRHAAHLL